MQDFFCVKQRNFCALFEHFAQKYPYFSKSGARGEIFSLFFANSMVFTKKSVKTKKPANAKRADRQKHAKKHRAKAVFFQVLHREGLRIVHLAFAPFGGKARFYGTLFLRFFTAFSMTIRRARRLASTHTFCFLSPENIYQCKLKFTRKSSIFICNRQQELFRRRFNSAASNASTAPSSFKSAAAICSSVNSTAPTDASTSNE